MPNPLPVYATLTVGQHVTHPAHGTGRITTLARNWRGHITGAEVEFTIRDLVRRMPCRVGDLTPLPPPVVALRVVEPVVA